MRRYNRCLVVILICLLSLSGSQIWAAPAQIPATKIHDTTQKAISEAAEIYAQEVNKLISALPEGMSTEVSTIRDNTLSTIENHLDKIKNLQQKQGIDNTENIIALLAELNGSTAELEQGVRMVAQTYGEAYQRAYGMNGTEESKGTAVTVGQEILSKISASLKKLQEEKLTIVTAIIAAVGDEQQLYAGKNQGGLSAKTKELLNKWANADREALQKFLKSTNATAGTKDSTIEASVLFTALQGQVSVLNETINSLSENNNLGLPLTISGDISESVLPVALYGSESGHVISSSLQVTTSTSSTTSLTVTAAQSSVTNNIVDTYFTYPSIPTITMKNGLPVDANGKLIAFTSSTTKSGQTLAAAVGFQATASFGDPYYIYGIGSVTDTYFAQRWNSNNGLIPSGPSVLDLSNSLGHYTYLKWGLWADHPVTSLDTNGFYQGAWLAVSEDQVTPLTSIATTGTAIYKGVMVGQTKTFMYNSSTNAANINWNVILNADFSKYTITGIIQNASNTTIGTLSAAWRTTGNSAERIVGNIVTSATDTTIGAARGVLVGGFFGSKAEEIGGIWDMVTTTGSETATGILATQLSTAKPTTDYPILPTITIGTGSNSGLPIDSAGNPVPFVTATDTTGQILAAAVSFLAPATFTTDGNIYNIYGIGSVPQTSYTQRLQVVNNTTSSTLPTAWGSYTYLQWGLWMDPVVTSVAPTSGFYQSAWLLANQKNITPLTSIATTGTAQYNGIVLGQNASSMYYNLYYGTFYNAGSNNSYYGYNGNNNSYYDSSYNITGYVYLTADFSKNTLSGSIKSSNAVTVGTISAAWNTTGNAADKIVGNISVDTTASSSSTTKATGVLVGAFFGSKGEEIGGVWDLAATDGSDTMTGILAAQTATNGAYFADQNMGAMATWLSWTPVTVTGTNIYGLGSAPATNYANRQTNPDSYKSGTVDSYTYLSWGTWNDSMDTTVNGFYQRNFLSASATSVSDITSTFFPQGGTAEYTGIMKGSTRSGSLLNWSVDLFANFRYKNVSGTITDTSNSNASNGYINASWQSSSTQVGSITGDIYKYTATTTGTTTQQSGTYGVLVGGFFGTHGEEIGGVWSLIQGTETATGILAAKTDFSSTAVNAAFSQSQNASSGDTMYGLSLLQGDSATYSTYSSDYTTYTTTTSTYGNRIAAVTAGTSTAVVETGGTSNGYSYLAWGYWNDNPTDGNYQQTWLRASAGSLTDVSTNNLNFPTTGTAIYNGTMVGHTQGSTGVPNIAWTVGLTTNFANQTMNGTITANGTSFANVITAKWTTGINSISGSIGPILMYSGGAVKGAFFGPTGQEIGAIWHLQSTSGANAAGILAAKK